jgi:hypothetical protein
MYWYKNGKRHRQNGPAIIETNGAVQYWVDGKLQPKPNDVKELTVAAIEQLLGYSVKIVK